MRREERSEYFSLHKKFALYEEINCNVINIKQEKTKRNSQYQKAKCYIFVC